MSASNPPWWGGAGATPTPLYLLCPLSKLSLSVAVGDICLSFPPAQLLHYLHISAWASYSFFPLSSLESLAIKFYPSTSKFTPSRASLLVVDLLFLPLGNSVYTKGNPNLQQDHVPNLFLQLKKNGKEKNANMNHSIIFQYYFNLRKQ